MLKMRLAAAIWNLFFVRPTMTVNTLDNRVFCRSATQKLKLLHRMFLNSLRENIDFVNRIFFFFFSSCSN